MKETYTFAPSPMVCSKRITLTVDGDVIECYRMEHEVPEWGSKTKWPQSALDILKGTLRR